MFRSTWDLCQRKVYTLLCIQFTLETDPFKNGFPASLTLCAAAQGQCSVGKTMPVCLFVGCFTSQQQPSVSQGRICSDNFTFCRTEIEVADQTIHLTQSQYTDTRQTSPIAVLIIPGAWQGSHWSANLKPLAWIDPENPVASGIRTPGFSAPGVDALTTRQRGGPCQ